MSFDELRRLPGFNGVPGVFADSLPDDFGNRVIRAYYAARSQDALAMSPVQRLLYVGDQFGIKGVRRLVVQVINTVQRWPDYAKGTGVPTESLQRIHRELERRRRELG